MKFIKYLKIFEDKLLNLKLIKYGFCQNYWVWAHIFLALILGKLLTALALGLIIKFIITFIVAILWEVFEYYIIHGKENIIKIYKTREKWKWDTVGDIVAALLAILFV